MSFGGSGGQARAAKKAAAQQVAMAQAGIDYGKQNYSYITKLLEPFITGGTEAFGAQGDILGLNGKNAENMAIEDIQNSPYYMTTAKQGEDAILQNASATGGLRGGNTEGALAQFRPELLQQFIQQHLANLGNLSNTGVQTAGVQTQAAGNVSNLIAGLLGQQGAAQAGGTIAAGNRSSNGFKNALSLGGTIAGFF